MMLNTEIRRVVTSTVWEKNGMGRSTDGPNDTGNVPVFGWVLVSQTYIHHIFSYILYNFVCSSMLHIFFSMYQILHEPFSFKMHNLQDFLVPNRLFQI